MHYPKCVEFYFLKGQIHQEKNEFDHALVEFNNSLKFSNNDPLIYEKLGEVHEALNNSKEAIKAYNQAICYDSRLESKLIPREIILYYKNKDYKKTIECCDKVC